MKHTIPGVLPQNHTQETLFERIAFVPSHCLPGKSVDSSPVQKNNGESKLNPFHRTTERRVWQVCRHWWKCNEVEKFSIFTDRKSYVDVGAYVYMCVCVGEMVVVASTRNSSRGS